MNEKNPTTQFTENKQKHPQKMQNTGQINSYGAVSFLKLPEFLTVRSWAVAGHPVLQLRYRALVRKSFPSGSDSSPAYQEPHFPLRHQLLSSSITCQEHFPLKTSSTNYLAVFEAMGLYCLPSYTSWLSSSHTLGCRFWKRL